MKITYTRRKGGNPYADLLSGPLSIEGEAEYRKQWIVHELLGLMEEQGITRAVEDQFSKVAEDPTPYRTKRMS